jgi:predicted esterase
MSPQEKELSFSFSARYFKLAPTSGASREIWFVLHGYGQLAQYFLKNFQAVADRGITLIAPEALSRFYLEDVQSRARSGNNRVGATWMTRENRLADIRNYITFLNQVYTTEVTDQTTPISILGFSQGAATASRWVIDSNIKFNRLILWAGVFPPDMDFKTGKEVLQDKKIVLAYGNKDPFLNDDRFTEMKMLSEKLKITAEVITFEGAHEINQDALMRLV